MAIGTIGNGKLKEIQEMALSLHRSLVDEFRDECFKRGGCLFLGKFYAESDLIYFGLNPGLTGEAVDPFDVQLRADGYNPPFLNSEEGNRTFSYWRNWDKFLSNHPDLRTWFNERVTSTFMVPWRTANVRELERLNTATGGKVFRYSGQLLRKMIEHHQARLIMVGGKRCLHLLNQLMDGPWDPKEVETPCEGPGRIYQWRCRRLLLGKSAIKILQVPHFARANDLRKLSIFADWLKRKLKEFGM